MKADALLSPVMIVDDDDNDALLAARCLKQAGVKNPLLHFRSGADAFQFLRKFCSGESGTKRLPCLMLLDVNMSELSGFDVLLWARQQPELKPMKIFVLSGASEEHDARIAAKLGADEYLQKFPQPAAFAQLVANAVTE